jgi:hypothetical protein
MQRAHAETARASAPRDAFGSRRRPCRRRALSACVMRVDCGSSCSARRLVMPLELGDRRTKPPHGQKTRRFERAPGARGGELRPTASRPPSSGAGARVRCAGALQGGMVERTGDARRAGSRTRRSAAVGRVSGRQRADAVVRVWRSSGSTRVELAELVRSVMRKTVREVAYVRASAARERANRGMRAMRARLRSQRERPRRARLTDGQRRQ